VEKPFLESLAILALRFFQAIPSKRGIIPPRAGVVRPHNIPAIFYPCTKGGVVGTLSMPEECVSVLMQSDGGELALPDGGPPPEGSVLSRFLAKVAVEAMARNLLKTPTILEQWISDLQVDPIRNHARRGENVDWPVHVRRIYDPDARAVFGKPQLQQTVHEFDFLQTERLEFYFVLALFGVEMTINVAGPIIDGYLEWLQKHNDASPLYYGKNDPNKTISP
jgi:hypothetical protein